MAEIEKIEGGASMTSVFNIISPVVIMLVALLCLVSIIALGVVFKKNNKNGWLAIVPLVNTYVLFKIFWDTNKFWMYFVLSLLMSIFSYLQLFANASGVFTPLIIFLSVLTLTISAMLYAKMAKAYGYGTGFAVGLLLLNPIFVIILATKRPVVQA